ncbi:MAG: COG4705 family protein [Flavisolibacter sp.]
MEKRNLDLNKVAKITLLFWILKILATTLGEVLGDFFSMTLNIGYSLSLLITFVLFIFVLLWQLRQDRFHAPIYWLVIIGTTTVGTEISDLMDRTFGLGYALGASILFASLLIVLFIWHRHVKEIKVYPITERRVELYYWFAILVSNSLGTAFGDFLSDNLGLSYLVGAAITAGVIVVVVLLHYFTKINRIVLFWIAFIFTRPFGATFGDFLTKPISSGGMNFSRGIAALATAAIMCLLMYLFQRKMNKKKVSFA